MINILLKKLNDLISRELKLFPDTNISIQEDRESTKTQLKGGFIP